MHMMSALGGEEEVFLTLNADDIGGLLWGHSHIRSAIFWDFRPPLPLSLSSCHDHQGCSRSIDLCLKDQDLSIELDLSSDLDHYE